MLHHLTTEPGALEVGADGVWGAAHHHRLRAQEVHGGGRVQLSLWQNRERERETERQTERERERNALANALAILYNVMVMPIKLLLNLNLNLNLNLRGEMKEERGER